MLANMSEAEWDAVIKVHLKGTAGPSHFAAAYWRDRSKAGEEVDGRIINTSSPSGIYGNVGQTNYGAAKAGIAAFTIIASMELARYGVTVNAIAPAALTRMTENLGMGQVSDEVKEQMSPQVDRPDHHLAGQRRVEGRDRSGVRRQRPGAVGERGLAPRPDRRARRSIPTLMGPLVEQLMAEARPNADMSGRRPTNRTEDATMPINPDAVGSKSEPVEHTLGLEGRAALRPRRRLPARSIRSPSSSSPPRTPPDIDQKVLPTMAVVLGVGGGAALGSHRLVQPGHARARRAGDRAARPDPGRGHGQHRRRGRRRLRQGQGRGGRHRGRRRPTRRPARSLFTNRAVAVHPGRGRLGRRPWPVRPAERGPRARARPHRHLSHPHRPGPPLPAVGRPQPAALRSRRSRRWAASTGRSSTACAPTGSPVGPCCTSLCGGDPARFTLDGGPLLLSGDAGRVAHGQACGSTATAPCSAPPATTAASSSTAAAVVSRASCRTR